jgi:5S rRNA maturation endonuclease (ribonuclease M5)
VVVEGEPDWLVRSIVFTSEAIVGIGSGSWTPGFAERVPYGSEVSILTHLDSAGDRYAAAIEKSVSERARVFRWTIDEGEAAA